MAHLNMWNEDVFLENLRALREILQRDDVKQFADFVSWGSGYVCFDDYPGLLKICLEGRAVQCTLYLVQGYLPHGPPDLRGQMFSNTDYPLLFLAVESMWDPRVFDLLLHDCGALCQANVDIDGLLPLHFLLHNIVKYDQHLCHWSLDNSLTKLLLYLFLQPAVIAKLDCARLLAEVTDSINDVALGFIQRGEIVQLASLLLVAHKEAMAPLCSGETIKQHSSLEWIVRHAHKGQCSRATISAAGLLDIFEKAGDALANYHLCMPDNVVEVCVQVAQIMHEAGFKVMCTDFDLGDIYTSGIQAEVLRSIQEKLDIVFDGTYKNIETIKKYAVSLPRIIDGGLSSVNCKADEVAKVAKLQQCRSGRYKYQPPINVGKSKSSWGYYLPNLAMKLKQRVKLV